MKRILILFLGIITLLPALADTYDTLTVTQALAIAQQLDNYKATDYQVYVRGVICSDVTCTNGTADFSLCDSESTIIVYHLNAPGRNSFEEGQLNNGDSVLLFGKLYNYNYKYEVYPATLVFPELTYTDWGILQPDYYIHADGTTAEELKDSLMSIIKGGIRLTYGSGSNKTWSGFYYTDRDTTDNSVLDMYSNTKRYFNQEDPTASITGMNIEHSFPKSWWGGTKNDAYKDLHHLTPSDASANSSKSNIPPGTVKLPAKFDNGSFKTGTPADTACHTSRVFEPADEYKGDFARMYFYIATAYGDLTWVGDPALNSVENGNWQVFLPWLRDLLMRWHRQDPVSEKEIRRMAEVSRIQHNRNPFIDYPCLAEYIWGNKQGEQVDLSKLLLTTNDEYLTTNDKSGCTCECTTTGFEQVTLPPEELPRIIMIDGLLRIVYKDKQYTITGMPIK